MSAPTLSARVAELEREARTAEAFRAEWQRRAESAERTRADVTRERDELAGWKRSAMEVLAEWDKVWEAAGKPGPLGSSKALNTLRVVATAERRATEAANRKAYERCLAMMIQATPLGVDEAPFEAWLSRVFPEFHPAVPPEREGAGAEKAKHGQPYDCARCGMAGASFDGCAIGECEAMTCRTTPPVEGAQECKVVEYDGAFKCLTHKRAWGAISNPDEPCRPTPPQAAPLYLRIQSQGADGQYITHDHERVLVTPADCQRIVETGRRASGREE